MVKELYVEFYLLLRLDVNNKTVYTTILIIFYNQNP